MTSLLGNNRDSPRNVDTIDDEEAGSCKLIAITNGKSFSQVLQAPTLAAAANPNLESQRKEAAAQVSIHSSYFDIAFNHQETNVKWFDEFHQACLRLKGLALFNLVASCLPTVGSL